MLLLRRRLVFLTMIISCIGYGQSSLEQQLEGKTTLREIMQVVDQYYLEHPEEREAEFESKYLHWKRWEWYMSNRLGPNGEFVNIPEQLIAGLHEKEKMEVPQDRNINSAWNFVGPSSSTPVNFFAFLNGLGRVDRIVFHPTNANIIFICTPAGGLWSTLNGGSTWTNLTDNLPSIGISGFIISWANPSIMYLLTGDGDSNIGGLVEQFGYLRPSIGVLKSTDGGVSWHPTGALPGATGIYTGYKMVQSPTDANTVLVATSVGLYRTTDGGATWSLRVTGKHYDVEFKPNDGTRAYSVTDGDFWLSTNSGLTWSNSPTFNMDPANCSFPGSSTSGGRMSIAVAPSSPAKVYVLAGPVTNLGQFCGLYVSIDSGNSFTRQSNSPNVLGLNDFGSDAVDQSGYDIALAVDPFNSFNIFAAGCTVWGSTNGGINWSHTTSWREDGLFPYIHPDVHDAAFNPLDSNLYVASDGGLFMSEDQGATWVDLSANIEASQIYHMDDYGGNANKLLCGFQDNGIKYRPSNTTGFTHIDCCDGFDVVFDPTNGQPKYGTFNQFVRKYSNDGANGVDITLPSWGFRFFKTLAIHNTDPDILLVGTTDIMKSIDGGSTFSNRAASGSWCLTSCPSNSTRFYSAGDTSYTNSTGGHFFFSGNTGDTWTLKTNNPGFPPNTQWNRISDIAVNPTNSSIVYACFGGFTAGIKVVRSANTGDTWTNISSNLPNVPINCLAIDNNDGIYAGTDIGVFYRSATMTNWMPWSNGLPNVPVTEMRIFDDGTIQRIRAATFGRGIWYSNLAATCDAAIVVTGGLEGIRHYEASTSITSTAFIQGGIGTFVSFKSGGFITLSDGFNVVDDSEFLGFISPCGVGGIPSAQDPFEINRGDPNSSIILLRRMWNPETELPYGSIDIIEKENDGARITFSINKPGEVQVYAAKAVQEKLISLYSGEIEHGKHVFHADLSSLSDDVYYLLLFYEGKLAHFQELDLHK